VQRHNRDKKNPDFFKNRDSLYAGIELADNELGVFHLSWGTRSETGPSTLWPVSDRASLEFSTHLKHTQTNSGFG
jgi:hypothetical protein